MALTAAGPTTAEIAADWSWRPLVLVPLVAAAVLYLWGVLRVRREHPARPWPLGRSAAFLGGLAVLAVALLSAIGRYDTVLFWVHMVQHLMLIMVAPALLIHGRPLILAMHATHNPWHGRIKRVLRSRVVTVVTCPLVAIPLYAAVVVVTHLTSFNNLVVRQPAVAAAEEATYLLVGYLYLLSGFGEEPIRWRLSRPAKILVLVLSMPIDTFTGITLLMTTTNPWPAYAARSWGPDPVTDVHYGGAMMWIAGDTIMIALMLAALVPWVAGRTRSSARLRLVENARRAAMDRYAAYAPASRPGGGDVDEDEARLDAYNAWLAAMAERDRRHGAR
ncbi:cytochrome c oxidase assembly protein [Mangrovihabitans endophyticus]|uniref:Membrane protein n=1 Tax=Mangrovihabitans endophyticus TaxID=1751298 RepID=A0A8J3FPA9_9ACTN|nr:cytochrome c oxidase assembly protein [Mangrovihabitans endophyticus]GGK99788.1 membrane protein [Mangrovihabitans endophyticus]